MKRLIVCCGRYIKPSTDINIPANLAADGTWLDSASGLMKGEIPLPSNVTRIAQAVKPVSRDGVNQVVYYQVCAARLQISSRSNGCRPA